MILAMQRELVMRADEQVAPIKTIYFGGGTPSLLTAKEISDIIDLAYSHYRIERDVEVTLEANPDDIDSKKLLDYRAAGVNRLSLGIQSFKGHDLSIMNRAHNMDQAIKALHATAQIYQNYSIDLIYGLPEQTMADWQYNLDIVQSVGVPHISCYALTQEPQTAMDVLIKKGQMAPLDEVQAQAHYFALLDWAEQNDYINYEFSNFGRPGFASKNNMAYWSGQPYIGIGPSAHSYDQKKRSWNKAHNIYYIRDVNNNELPSSVEVLRPVDHFNEYVMTRLRTASGINLNEIEENFGPKVRHGLYQEAQKHLKSGVLTFVQECLVVTRKGKFLSDGIASDLFLLNLEE